MTSRNEIITLLEEGLIIGEQIYLLLKSKCPASARIVICPMHIGDTVLLAAYAKAYKEENKCEYLIYVVNDYQSSLLKLWPDIDDFIALSRDKMEALSYYIMVSGKWDEDGILYAGFKSGLAIFDKKLLLYRTEEINDTVGGHAKRYLKLDANALPVRINRFPKDVNLNNSSRSREVILFPYAKSEKMLPEEFWSILAERLNERGLCVYSNYNGMVGEYIIPGTKPLASDFDQLIEYCYLFRAFISIRSGICDLIAQTDAPLHVLYFTEMYWDDKDFREIGKTDHLWKYKFDGKDYRKLVDQIVEQVGE